MPGILRQSMPDRACRLLKRGNAPNFRNMKTALAALAWLVASMFVSELLGYLLHRLLHSGKVGFLSRSHMRHHLVLYGPLHSQRPGSGYLDATVGEAALFNIGMEWIIPGAILLAASVTVLHILRVTLFHQAVFIAGTLSWSFIMFSYLHDRMHIDGFWMERHPLLKRWFLGAREAHDIHHWALNDRGFMDKNFGIAFFLFDRVFGTWTAHWPSFNRRGYKNALRRFADVLDKGIPRRNIRRAVSSETDDLCDDSVGLHEVDWSAQTIS
jgi:sterol desaturase/sphingolipid hydroxylase (fatty acid hydroxylase superfamily)